jgi:hypothetical protein
MLPGVPSSQVVPGVEKTIKKDQTGTVRKVRGLARQKDYNTLLAVLRWKGYKGDWFELASNLSPELLAEPVVAELGHHLRVTRRSDLAGSQCRGARDYEDAELQTACKPGPGQESKKEAYHELQ